MSQNKLICFSGTDGTGKSTLALRVSQNLQMRGKRTKLVYGRHRPFVTTIIYIIGRRLFLSKSNMFSNYDGYLNDKRTLHKKQSKLTKIYYLTILIEYLIQVLFKVAIPYKMGYWIVSDRYVYDTIINDMAVDSMLSTNDVCSIVSKFWRYIPRPNLSYLIKIPEELALTRKSDIPSQSYLRIRNEYYDKLANIEGMIVLDGTKEISELESLVIKKALM